MGLLFTSEINTHLHIHTILLQVKADCFSILDEFGIGWPEPLNCAQFPDPPELCMKPTEDEISGGFSAPRVPSKVSSSSSSKPTGCPSDLVDVDPHDPKSHCAFSCQSNVMFSTDNKVLYFKIPFSH